MLSRGIPAVTSSGATPRSVPSYWIQTRPSQMSTCTIVPYTRSPRSHPVSTIR
jgi:hypothetical protein